MVNINMLNSANKMVPEIFVRRWFQKNPLDKMHGQKGTSGQASGLNISFFADYKKRYS
jgi:hypothetical protein